MVANSLLRSATLVGCLVVLCSCGTEAEQRSQSPLTQQVSTNPSGLGGAAINDLGGTAHIEIGGEVIDGLDWIRCYSSTTPRPGVIAEGKYQGELLRIVMEMLGAGSAGAIQVNVRREVWKLHEGQVEVTSDGKTFSGFGTLKGQDTAPPKNGIAKFIPLENDVRRFSITIECH